MKTDYNCKIVTGQYQAVSENAQKMIQELLGENAQYRYEIYFHWYNLIHELGHAVMMFNNPARPHPAEEEQLVNNFAVAYWRHYGETDKLRELALIVEHTLSHITAPSPSSYMEYAMENWGNDSFRTFKSYGWFQLSSVQNALSRKITLEEALGELCVFSLVPQEKKLLSYDEKENMAQKVVADAVTVLQGWGICLPPQIPVSFCDDVNCHMFCCEDYDRARSQIEQAFL